MGKNTLEILRYLLIFGLICCFSICIFDSAEKYLARKTSLSITEKVVDPEPLPAFSICADPPFNEPYMRNELKVPGNLFFITATSNDPEEFPQNLTSFNTDDENNLQSLWKKSVVAPSIIIVGKLHLYTSIIK